MHTEKKPAHVFTSSGSTENTELVESKQVMFAFCQNDIAFMAHNGMGMFQNKKASRNLRALCSLYPESVQIIVKKGGKIQSIQDLRGKKINIGLPGSGVRINALQILQAVGLNIKKDFANVKELPLPIAVEEFKEGKLDVIFVTSAYPAKAVQKLASQTPVKLISLEEKTVNKIVRKYPFFIPIHISQKAYKGVKGNVRSVGVTAMIITHKDTPDEKVKTFLEHLFKSIPVLSKESLQANYISKEQAQTGMSIPMHKAAKKFFGK